MSKNNDLLASISDVSIEIVGWALAHQFNNGGANLT
jgi:hypothetical protein